MIEAQEIGANLRAARLARGISINRLCAISGLPKQTIWHVERAEYGTSVRVLIQICDALGVSMDAVCGRDVCETKNQIFTG